MKNNIKKLVSELILEIDMVFRGILRDFNAENLIRKASRVEKQLREDSLSARILRSVPGSLVGGNLICMDGRMKVHIYTPFAPALPLTSAEPFDIQPETEPLVTCCFHQHGFMSEQIMNSCGSLQSPFFWTRLSHVVRPPSMPDFNLITVNGVNTSISFHDKNNVHSIGNQLGITGNWIDDSFKEDGAYSRVFYDPAAEYDSNAHRIPVNSADEAFAYMLELLPYGGRYVLLPVSFYRHPALRKLLRLYTPHQNVFEVLHADHIAMNPEATIFLTDEIGIVLNNLSSPKAVFSAVIGGDEVIARLNVDPLRGRRVIWLLVDLAGIRPDPKTKWVTAMKIAKKLNGHSIDLNFIEFENFRWDPDFAHLGQALGCYEAFEVYDLDMFIRKAMAKGIYIPEELRPLIINNITGSDLELLERQPYLIYPIMREATSTIIYGGTGCLKSWLAISMGAAAANGKSVFLDHWPFRFPCGVKSLTIAGEMYPGEYGERIKRLHQHYAEDKAHKDNFILHPPGHQLDLASREGYEKLHAIIDDAEKNCGIPGDPVKLVILDNLTTLSVEGENPSNFGRIEYLLQSLQKRGIAVVLVHHENNKGDIRGARKIGDVMDMKLHIFKAEDGDNLSFIVKNEKVRSEKQSEFATFKASLDIEAEGTGWVVSEPTPEELLAVGAIEKDDLPSDSKPKRPAKTKYNLKAWKAMTDKERIESILKQVEQGLTNPQIAANLNCGKSTICEFRKEHGIRDCDMKNGKTQEDDV